MCTLNYTSVGYLFIFIDIIDVTHLNNQQLFYSILISIIIYSYMT